MAKQKTGFIFIVLAITAENWGNVEIKKIHAFRNDDIISHLYAKCIGRVWKLMIPEQVFFNGQFCSTLGGYVISICNNNYVQYILKTFFFSYAKFEPIHSRIFLDDDKAEHMLYLFIRNMCCPGDLQHSAAFKLM